MDAGSPVPALTARPARKRSPVAAPTPTSARAAHAAAESRSSPKPGLACSRPESQRRLGTDPRWGPTAPPISRRMTGSGATNRDQPELRVELALAVERERPRASCQNAKAGVGLHRRGTDFAAVAPRGGCRWSQRAARFRSTTSVGGAGKQFELPDSRERRWRAFGLSGEGIARCGRPWWREFWRGWPAALHVD